PVRRWSPARQWFGGSARQTRPRETRPFYRVMSVRASRPASRPDSTDEALFRQRQRHVERVAEGLLGLAEAVGNPAILHDLAGAEAGEVGDPEADLAAGPGLEVGQPHERRRALAVDQQEIAHVAARLLGFRDLPEDIEHGRLAVALP